MEGDSLTERCRLPIASFSDVTEPADTTVWRFRNLLEMTPNVRKQAADFLNRFGLATKVTVDDLPAAISDGSVVASLLSRFYPDQIDISRLILPVSSLHSKMHNWSVINECLSSALDNGQLLSLASANDDNDAIETLIDHLREILPEEDRTPFSVLRPDQSAARTPRNAPADTKFSKLVLETIETCEGTIRYLNEQTATMADLLRQLRTIHDENDNGNQFDRLLSARQPKHIRPSRKEKPVTKSEKKPAKRSKVTKPKGATTKLVKRTKKISNEVSSAKEDRIMSLIGRFDALLQK